MRLASEKFELFFSEDDDLDCQSVIENVSGFIDTQVERGVDIDNGVTLVLPMLLSGLFSVSEFKYCDKTYYLDSFLRENYNIKIVYSFALVGELFYLVVDT